jgi:hypothetical protein
VYFTGFGPVNDGTPMNLYVLSGGGARMLDLRGAGCATGGADFTFDLDATNFDLDAGAFALAATGTSLLGFFAVSRRRGFFAALTLGLAFLLFFGLSRAGRRTFGLGLKFFLSFRLERFAIATALFRWAAARVAAFLRAFFVARFFFFFSALRAAMGVPGVVGWSVW